MFSSDVALHVICYISLHIQTPAEKVLGPPKYTYNTFSGGIWMSRVSGMCQFQGLLVSYYIYLSFLLVNIVFMGDRPVLKFWPEWLIRPF